MHFQKISFSVDTPGSFLAWGTTDQEAIGHVMFLKTSLHPSWFPWICGHQLDDPCQSLGLMIWHQNVCKTGRTVTWPSGCEGHFSWWLNKTLVSEHYFGGDWEVTHALASSWSSPIISPHKIQDGKCSYLWVMPITKGMDLELIKTSIQHSIISQGLTNFTLDDVLFFKS